MLGEPKQKKHMRKRFSAQLELGQKSIEEVNVVEM